MSIMDFITFLSKLPVTNNENSVFKLILPVKPHVCPNCQTTTSKIHSYRDQKIKDVQFLSADQILIYRKRRYICPHCSNTFPEKNTFIARYQRMTKNTIAAIINEHELLVSSSDIALRYKISTTTVQRIFSNVSPASNKLSPAISIDEFKGDTGAKFQVVINDLINNICLNVIEDRTPDVLYAKMLEYPLEERLKVLHVSIDLSAPFKKMIQECFPNAQIAADKFHTVRLANDALDSIRRQVQAQLSPEMRKYFKKSRRLLLSRENNLKTDDDKYALQVILHHSDKLSAAYAMKEAYFRLMDSKDSKEFTDMLKKFQLAVEKQDIKEFKRVLQTTIKWKKEIIHSIATGYNNGFTEGCNTTIKNLKRICYSFRNFHNFKRRIIFLLNSPSRRLRRSPRNGNQIAA